MDLLLQIQITFIERQPLGRWKWRKGNQNYRWTESSQTDRERERGREMPKNNTTTRSRSTRKPLSEISNCAVRTSGSYTKSSSTTTTANVKKPLKEEKHTKKNRHGDKAAEDNGLDQLLLVHSDLSSLIHQVDELVVQALNSTSEIRRAEVEAFSNVLSKMQSSLKPWVNRFQNAVSAGPGNQMEQSLPSNDVSEDSHTNNSPEQTKLDTLVSPSPLVSWRANCTVEGSRQMFLLTPLPRPKVFSSKCKGSAKSVIHKITSGTDIQPSRLFDMTESTNDDLLEGMTVEPTPRKSTFQMRGSSMLVMTPCLKMSPPKSCVLLEPISEISHKDNNGYRKSTPFPVRFQDSGGSTDSDSSSSQVTEHLTLKYPELFGIRRDVNDGNKKKFIEESPNWLMSPPKSCILMEPPDEKLLKEDAGDSSLQMSSSLLDQQINPSLVNERGGPLAGQVLSKTCTQELNLSKIIESTPMVKEPETTIQMGKRPGENTLKKELWTKFEAASKHGIRTNISDLQETAEKGFLDRLEEASCGETSQTRNGLRR